MRYLLHAALYGVIAIAAGPASAAVVMTVPEVDVPTTASGLSAEVGVAGGFSLTPSSNAYTSLTRDLGAARGPNRFPIIAASEEVATLPEPASWGLMILGFGGLSFALRSRARTGDRIRFS